MNSSFVLSNDNNNLSSISIKKRDNQIDILRAIALLCIICAHVSPPSLLTQFRSFDVPMMVFLSGVVFIPSWKRNKGGYIQYVSKRFIRIVVPTWIFLFLYYCLERHDIEFVLTTFTFKTGWYVWIMRVFFSMALLSPIVLLFFKINKINNVLLLLFFLLILNEFLGAYIGTLGSGNILVILEMTIPYFVIFTLGSQIGRLNRKTLFILLFLSLLCYLFFALVLYQINGYYVLTNVYKYPPRLYYISYALSCVLLMWIYKNYISILIERLYLNNVLIFIGRHTMWIYFWHIPLVERVALGFYLYNFLVVLLLSCLLTYIQHTIILIISKRLPHNIANYLKIIFDS